MVGSPYLYEAWFKGAVKLADGKLYNNMKLKYDQVEDQLIFKYGEEPEMSFTSEVRAFNIYSYTIDGEKIEVNFVNGFPPIDEGTEKSYYQVFDPGKPGKMELVKRSVKKVYELRLYNSATTEQRVEVKNYYYVLIDNHLLKLKRDYRALLEYMKPHEEKIIKYIKTNKLSFKEDADFVTLVKYYNTL